MVISSKKLLSTLAALSAISLTASSVVSCGFNMNRIINRQVSTNVYNTTFSYPVTSWNTAYTMQSEDQLVLANTNASLIALDSYGRLYGDIFKSNSDLSKNQVGESSDNSQTWTYQMREGLKWRQWNGTEVAEIKPGDLLKTAWFALNSNVTSSAVGSLWRSFIAGAEEVTATLNEKGYTYEEFEKAYYDDEFSYFGLMVDDDDYTVTFKLTKPAPYFESLLAYSAFSPVYSSNQDKITDFKMGYYSGAYLPKSVSSEKMTLQKNDMYHFTDEMTVDEINYISTGSGGVNVTRTLFEAGNITGFTVASGDSLGWNRYIGDDWRNPVFDQVYDAPSARQTSTFTFFFNAYNGNIGSNDKSGQYVTASKMMQNEDVRAFLATGLNRNEFVRYYSQQFDGTSEVSKMLRNTYTSPTVGTDSGRDYTDFLADVARTETGSTDTNLLTDGTDFLLNNSEILTESGKTRAKLIEDIRTYINENNLHTNSDGKVVFEFLVNPNLNATLNPYLQIMLNSFNNIENNPISIVFKTSASSADYQALAQEGKFDLYNGGWGPDFADPATFLATLALDGDLRHYTGTSRLISSDGKLLNENLKVEGVTDEYIKAMQEYTNEFKRIDTTLTDSTTDRFKAFAELEYKFMYEDFMFMPVYSAALPKNYNVSHLEPHSITYTTTYGISNYKTFTAKINEKLLTAAELKMVFEEYDQMMDKIKDNLAETKTGHAFWS